jgi:tripartite-type tricarboxylate transporter receptor subunit TctC
MTERWSPRRRALLVAAAVVAAAGSPPSSVVAQEAFPTKPVTIWVGFPAGGGTDIPTRALAEGMEKLLGQKVVVVNKPGAGGVVATSELVRARPDGYTLMANTDTPITRAPHMRELDYDPFRDLTPLVQLGRLKLVLLVREGDPFKTWRDVVEWAKKNPGQLTFGNPGIGTTPALIMPRIAAREGFTFKSVPFAGDAPSLTALLGGHVVMTGGASVSAASYVQARRLRVLLVSDREGLDYAPEAPSFDKAGYDVETSTSLLLYGPKGMPPAVAERLEKAVVSAMQTEPFVSVARKTELIVGERVTGQQLAESLRKVSANYETLIKEAGLHKSQKK